MRLLISVFIHTFNNIENLIPALRLTSGKFLKLFAVLEYIDKYHLVRFGVLRIAPAFVELTMLAYLFRRLLTLLLRGGGDHCFSR